MAKCGRNRCLVVGWTSMTGHGLASPLLNLLLLPARGEKVGMRGRRRCLSICSFSAAPATYPTPSESRRRPLTLAPLDLSPHAGRGVSFVIARSEATKQSRTASRLSQAALDCFAAARNDGLHRSRAALFVRAPRFVHDFTKRASPREAERRKARSQRPRPRTGGAPPVYCAIAARAAFGGRARLSALYRGSRQVFRPDSVRSRASW
jgi:hypothetical protein